MTRGARFAVAVVGIVALAPCAFADDWKDCANVFEEEPAIAACSRLLARGNLSRTNRSTVHSNRGAAYLNLGDHDLAMRDLNEAVHLDARSGTALYNRGATLFLKGEYERAITDLTRAIRLEPAHAKSHLYRGRALLALDRQAEAIKDFTMGLTLEPDSANLLRYRGRGFQATGDYNSALADYDRAVRLEPNNASLLNSRADVLLKLGRLDAALADTDRALAVEPQLALALATPGEVLEAIGRSAEARTMYERALERDPSLQEATEGMARLRRELRRPESAGGEARANQESVRGPLAALPAGQATDQLANRAQLASLQAAYNTLGIDLLGQLAKESKAGRNVVISPYSIATAMAMTLYGASGETEREMRQVLLQTLPRKDMAETNALALALLRRPAPPAAPGMSEGPAFEIKVANGLALGPTGGQISKQYVTDVAANFNSKVLRNANLASINRWVRERTDGRIDAILDNLHPQFPLVLLNAVTMTARWADLFDARETRDAPFTIADGERVMVPTLHREGAYAVAEWRGLRAIKVPYADGAVALLVVVPDTVERFGGPDLNISMRDLDPLLASLAQAKVQPVELALPKLKVSFKENLVPSFKRLGLTRAFTPRAEFEHMLESGAVLIDQIQHRVEIEVAEKGTEAAAATAVAMAPGSGRADPNKRTISFRVDRPFLFFIADYKSGTMLFAGRVAELR